jgi:hypothetical protein
MKTLLVAGLVAGATVWAAAAETATFVAGRPDPLSIAQP